jgi:ABC-type antimicrobial peptide transport system permease subunit
VNDFVLEGTEEPGPGQPTWNAGVTAVRANYFDAMGIEILNGRGFDASLDGASGSPISVVVSRGLVDRFLPGADPLGRRMHFAGTEDQQWWTIVGVVEDVQHQSLGNQGSPMYYLLPEPLSRVGGSGWDRGGWIVLETDADRPLEYADPLRRIVAEADPNVPVTNLGTLDSIVGESIARQRFIRTLLGAFAGLALALGAIGVYGVTSFGVSQRRHELGIHRALGAESGRVMSLVIRQGLAPVAIGLAVGVLAAASTGRFLGSLLFGIEPSDLPTYGAVFVVLFSVAFVAVWLPARRAARLDPMASLRSD